MHRKFITFVAAASIALTTLGSAPAFAGDRDTARALAAILGVAVIGSILHEKNKKKKARVEHHKPHRVYEPPRYRPTPRPLPKQVNRKLLPKHCFRSFDTYHGKIRMFGNRCLKKNYAHAHRLPNRCFYVFDTPKGDRRGYEARCLRDAGYRLARG